MPVVADVQGRDIGQLPAPSSLQGLSMVVHASGCVSLLLYVLLYEVACKPQGSSARLLPDNFSSLALAVRPETKSWRGLSAFRGSAVII